MHHDLISLKVLLEVFLNKCIEHYPDNATPYYFSVFWQRKLKGLKEGLDQVGAKNDIALHNESIALQKEKPKKAIIDPKWQEPKDLLNVLMKE